ncbi:MAG: YezD family protein [Sporomusaceae bacterium]|nr:YezD family protein [Sporomusaceae bacterium]
MAKRKETKAVASDIKSTALSEESLDRIEAAIEDIEFGSLTLIVQDGRVIQMDKLDKIRLHS